jgi:hypothetical protein
MPSGQVIVLGWGRIQVEKNGFWRLPVISKRREESLFVQILLKELLALSI